MESSPRPPPPLLRSTTFQIHHPPIQRPTTPTPAHPSPILRARTRSRPTSSPPSLGLRIPSPPPLQASIPKISSPLASPTILTPEDTLDGLIMPIKGVSPSTHTEERVSMPAQVPAPKVEVVAAKEEVEAGKEWRKIVWKYLHLVLGLIFAGWGLLKSIISQTPYLSPYISNQFALHLAANLTTLPSRLSNTPTSATSTSAPTTPPRPPTTTTISNSTTATTASTSSSDSAHTTPNSKARAEVSSPMRTTRSCSMPVTLAEQYARESSRKSALSRAAAGMGMGHGHGHGERIKSPTKRLAFSIQQVFGSPRSSFASASAESEGSEEVGMETSGRRGSGLSGAEMGVVEGLEVNKRVGGGQGEHEETGMEKGKADKKNKRRGKGKVWLEGMIKRVKSGNGERKAGRNRATSDGSYGSCAASLTSCSSSSSVDRPDPSAILNVYSSAPAPVPAPQPQRSVSRGRTSSVDFGFGAFHIPRSDSLAGYTAGSSIGMSKSRTYGMDGRKKCNGTNKSSPPAPSIRSNPYDHLSDLDPRVPTSELTRRKKHFADLTQRLADARAWVAGGGEGAPLMRQMGEMGEAMHAALVRELEEKIRELVEGEKVGKGRREREREERSRERREESERLARLREGIASPEPREV